VNNVLDQFLLTDQVIVITGGAGLLGRQHAEAVAQAGGVPVLLDIAETQVREAAGQIAQRYEGRAIGLRTDITRYDEVEAACRRILEEFGRMDGLVNNAANDPKMRDLGEGPVPSRFEHFDQAVWDQDLAVGLTGAYLCSQIFGSHMARQGHGVILNIASDLGCIAPDQRIYRQEGVPGERQPVKPVTYSVVKHGLIGLTRYLATYWAHNGVRVNAVCPGGIYQNQPDVFVEKLTNLIPMGRMARADEYQAAVLFLLSEAASYMTGAVVNIDGGRTCW